MQFTQKNGRRKALAALTTVSVAAALSLAGCSTTGGDPGETDETPYYEGKTITMIVPTDAGGTVDTAGRFLAEFLTEYVPGNPKVVVENITGGNQLVGANEYMTRDHDGTELFINGNGTTLYQLLGNPQKIFDYGDFSPLIAFGGNALVAANEQSGITDGKSLDAADSPIYGGLSASGTDLPNMVALELLGVDYTPVLGYESNASKRLAFLQGEMDLSSDSTQSFLREMKEEYESGQINFIYSYGPMEEDGTLGHDPLLPDVPNVHELYKQIHGKEVNSDSIVDKAYMAIIASRALSNVLWVFKDAPDEAQQALSEAVDAMIADPDFTAGLDAALGGNQPSTGDAIQPPLQAVLNPDPTVVEWIKDFLLKKFDVTI